MTDQISRLFRALPEAAAAPLRIGVLVDGSELPRVFRGFLEDIRAADFAQLSLLIVNDEHPEPSQATGGVARYVRTITDPRRRRHA